MDQKIPNLTISVSEWWVLKMGWVMNSDALLNGDPWMLPSSAEDPCTDIESATCASVFGEANTHSRSATSFLVVVSSRETPTAPSSSG